ncbi:MAG: sodium:solute symporter family transporter, partial [Paraclostridium sp.]
MISMSGSIDKIGVTTIFLWVFSILPGGITNQLYFQRVCSIEDEKQVNKSLILSAIITLIGFAWAVFMGITINTINPGIDGNSATGWFMTQLPTPLLAGFAALIFATMMSTVSSGVQSVVVNITRDILPIVKPNLDSDKVLKLSRTLSLVVMVIAVLMCLVSTDTLGWLVSTYAFSAATLLCPIYVGYAFRNTNFITKEGIIASMIAGAVGCVIGMVLETVINYAAIGIMLSLITLLIVSKLTNKKSNIEA